MFSIKKTEENFYNIEGLTKNQVITLMFALTESGSLHWIIETKQIPENDLVNSGLLMNNSEKDVNDLEKEFIHEARQAGIKVSY